MAVRAVLLGCVRWSLRVRSGGYGFTVKRNIVYAYLPLELAKTGTMLEIDVFEAVYPAVVSASVLVDPEGEKTQDVSDDTNDRAESHRQEFEDWRGKQTGYTAALGGLTNTNYRVDVDGIAYFVRIPGAKTGCWQSTAKTNTTIQKRGKDRCRLKVLYHLPEHDVMVLEFINGQTMSNQLLQSPHARPDCDRSSFSHNGPLCY